MVFIPLNGNYGKSRDEPQSRAVAITTFYVMVFEAFLLTLKSVFASFFLFHILL